MKIAQLIVMSAACLCAISAALGQDGDSLRTTTLDEIVIVGAQPERDTLQNFYRANPAATTEAIMSRISGVSLIRRGAYGQEPVLRSLRGGQINVTVDGMKMFGACTDKMDPVTIYVEPVNLSAIQTIAGTEGAVFGSTFGGSFDLKTAEPRIREEKLSGRAGIDFQTAARALNYFAGLNFSRGQRAAYHISTVYRKSHNYRSGGGEIVRFSQYEKVNMSASGKWTLTTTDTLLANLLIDEGYNIGFPALPMDVAKATAGIFSLTWNRSRKLLFFHHGRVKIYHNRVTHAMDDSFREGVVLRMDMPGVSRTSGAMVEGDIHILHDQRTFAKLEYHTNHSLGEMTMYPEDATTMYMQTAPASQRHDVGVFLRQDFRLDKRNKLTVSWRTDIFTDRLEDGIGRQQWEVFHPSLAATSGYVASTFSATFTHKFRPNIVSDIKTGYGERAPTIHERFGYYLFDRFDGYDYLGGPDLHKEKSWNAETTISYFGRNVEFRVAPYYQRISAYIVGKEVPGSTMTAGARGVKEFGNAGTACLSGIDAVFMTRPVAPVQLIASVKYTYGRYGDGKPMPMIPPLTIVSSFRYDMKRFHVQAEWETAAAQQRPSAMTGERSTPAWSVFNVRTGYRFNSFFECGAGLDNIFDENYREHLDWSGIPRPGKNLNITAVYIFKQ